MKNEPWNFIFSIIIEYYFLYFLCLNFIVLSFSYIIFNKWEASHCWTTSHSLTVLFMLHVVVLLNTTELK